MNFAAYKTQKTVGKQTDWDNTCYVMLCDEVSHWIVLLNNCKQRTYFWMGTRKSENRFHGAPPWCSIEINVFFNLVVHNASFKTQKVVGKQIDWENPTISCKLAVQIPFSPIDLTPSKVPRKTAGLPNVRRNPLKTGRLFIVLSTYSNNDSKLSPVPVHQNVIK